MQARTRSCPPQTEQDSMSMPNTHPSHRSRRREASARPAVTVSSGSALESSTSGLRRPGVMLARRRPSGAGCATSSRRGGRSGSGRGLGGEGPTGEARQREHAAEDEAASSPGIGSVVGQGRGSYEGCRSERHRPVASASGPVGATPRVSTRTPRRRGVRPVRFVAGARLVPIGTSAVTVPGRWRGRWREAPRVRRCGNGGGGARDACRTSSLVSAGAGRYKWVQMGA